MNILNELKDILASLPIINKYFREFIILCLVIAVVSLHYLNLDLNKSLYVLSDQAAVRQYTLDTVEINYLKVEIRDLKLQVKESNYYNNLLIENTTYQNKLKNKKQK